jgi:hypothetical protein
MTRTPSSIIPIVALSLAILGGTAICAEDKYSLKSPSGIAFSDFRGYEDWAVVSSGFALVVKLRRAPLE